MNEELLESIRKLLPRGWRLSWYCMPVDYPLEVVPLELYPPPLHLVEVAQSRGFLGLFRKWRPIGEIHIEEDVIYLRGKYYEQYFSILAAALAPLGDKIRIAKGISKASAFYREMVELNNLALIRSGQLPPDGKN